MKMAQVDPDSAHQNGHLNTDLDALKANRMLHTLGDEEIRMVLDAGRWVMFEPEETICRQATPVGEILIWPREERRPRSQGPATVTLRQY